MSTAWPLALSRRERANAILRLSSTRRIFDIARLHSIFLKYFEDHIDKCSSGLGCCHLCGLPEREGKANALRVVDIAGLNFTTVGLHDLPAEIKAKAQTVALGSVGMPVIAYGNGKQGLSAAPSVTLTMTSP
jgi:hypothetical protein